MRGSLAKELRKVATGLLPDGTEALDRPLYRKLKKMYKADKPGKEPKLEKNPRWYRSPLRRAKKPTSGDGLHFRTYGPVAAIGNYYGDLNAKGRQIALNIARSAGRLAKPELERRIAHLRTTKEYYAEGFEPQEVA